MSESLADPGPFFSSEQQQIVEPKDLQAADVAEVEQFEIALNTLLEGSDSDLNNTPSPIERILGGVASLTEDRNQAFSRISGMVEEFGVDNLENLQNVGAPTLEQSVQLAQESMQHGVETTLKLHQAQMELTSSIEMKSWISTLARSVVNLVKSVVVHTR
ncbi:hypothetical protein FKG94_22590 [Exilibacterium tricleocarpae]|uniref:Uncharacterized protein n=1 Tax=Exilibacterium tricleocarpae TaxID=2591008 RepID=A0A545SYA6_9GAMM|nr:hypothetical protein [Exilibacterium tricleocarpae]TQV69943.1 hypothetical protein FKG94_22590 [Exilibacterium tricleocarpae]